METNRLAAQSRIAGRFPANEPPVAVLARQLIGANGVVIDGALLQAGDATHVAALLSLLGVTGAGSNDSIGGLATIAAGTSVSVSANEQAAVFGTFTIIGTLTLVGEVRFGAWPF